MVIFNDHGVLAGATNFKWDKVANAATVYGKMNVNSAGVYAQANRTILKTSVAKRNTRVGVDALIAPTGGLNTAIGDAALKFITTGVENTASGCGALAKNTTGSGNTAVGREALVNNVGGGGNTAVGAYAGTTGTAKVGCTLIGASAQASDGLSSATAIGAGASVTQSNSMSLGALGTKVGINTTAPGSYLDIVGSVAARVLLYNSNSLLDDTVLTALGDASGGAITISLPPAGSAVGRIYSIKKYDAGINVVTVMADGIELIDASNTYLLPLQYDHVMIQSDGTQWWII